ncbi:2-oxoacid:acceptor oxidoreductase subunit alpha [Fusibacter bizertensis]|jgi:Pyruvate:ferredoxin oxidoreductase and related 2-oxoacid:ferredoxin oxidoreductases, alpha subunit|uniref:2-oxoacid:acceptor oxidoreductase subunit alpha n=1 Tax=Fusibacter bizertensis TaxID=1488331 RepID=A0ABT6N9I3_9FIRM|nr:2-oxoacid:acceptor oxidoreductase subunit alpha [Fusibacter bizertensis]MDH8677060.1 2-oxoacid:acceptor oxidoreductase subunit alpha [Fusibacter bizertensis]
MARKVKFLQGNEACVEGALMAGMTFYSGYPITPSTEIAELSAEGLPRIGGKFIQMEDEIAGIAAAIGASLTGAKAMTATSGPGFSLKQENIGYAALTEVPVVIVNVQRGGPSTGLPTAPGQGDLMQAMWGTHGDHPVICLTPDSVKETFDLTIRAFNLAEKYRTPVILLTDEITGHMREKIEIPDQSEIEIYNRIKPTLGEDYKAYKVYDGDIVPKMADFGSGFRYHVTGLMHDETGFPSNSTKNAAVLMDRLMAKIENNKEDIITYEEIETADAEYLIVAYGGTARTAKAAIKTLRAEGIKVGLFRPITVWPFPEKQVVELSEKVKDVLVAELNYGQMKLEVERVVKGNCPVRFCGKANGEVLTPEELIRKFKEVL